MAPGNGAAADYEMHRAVKGYNLRRLDGQEWDEWPEVPA